MDTFSGDLQLAALGDFDRLGRLVTRLRLHVLDLLYDVVALKDLAEDDMAAVEPAAAASTSAKSACKTVLSSAMLRTTYEVTTVVMKN